MNRELNLTKLNEIFKDALEEIKTYEIEHDVFNMYRKHKFSYYHNNTCYVASICTKTFKDISIFHIKLANDNFFYTDNFESNSDFIGRNGLKTWYRLNSKYVKEIKDILLYVSDKLESKIIKVNLYYKFEDKKMDIKFFNSDTNKCIVISFEPGYPEVEFSQDAWTDILMK